MSTNIGRMQINNYEKQNQKQTKQTKENTHTQR